MARLFAFAHVLHMTPRDVDALTVAEYDHLAADLDAYMAEMQRQTRDAQAATKRLEGVGRR